MGRKIEHEVVYKALTVAMIFAFLIIVSSLAVYNLNPNVSGLDAAYEVTSAISTSGLSTGVTAKCNVISKVILIIIMFIGRVGPVSLALSISMNTKRGSKNEICPVGKVMVG